ncbi:MAG: hypothetical protein R3F14_17110 [Polyangiaceae bacterium]
MRAETAAAARAAPPRHRRHHRGTAGSTGGTTGTCNGGDVEPCYDGPPGTENVGICKAGQRTCLDNGFFGPCVDQVVPKEEICDFDSDNLEGRGLQRRRQRKLPKPICTPKVQEACYTGPPGTLGIGNCQSGMRECLSDGTGFGPCIGEVTPSAEVCATPK